MSQFPQRISAVISLRTESEKVIGILLIDTHYRKPTIFSSLLSSLEGRLSTQGPGLRNEETEGHMRK